MAHIHRGAKGTNGPVVVPLEKNGDTYSVPAGRKLTPQQMERPQGRQPVRQRAHPRNKGGEVRGQLQP